MDDQQTHCQIKSLSILSLLNFRVGFDKNGLYQAMDIELFLDAGRTLDASLNVSEKSDRSDTCCVIQKLEFENFFQTVVYCRGG